MVIIILDSHKDVINKISIGMDINLTTINPNDHFKTGSKKIYQVQAINESNNALIYEVGVGDNLSDVLIKDFNIEDYQLRLISKLHDEESLHNCVVNKRFELIRLAIYVNQTLLGYLSFVFTCDTKNKKYISNNFNRFLLSGFFKIMFHTKIDGQRKIAKVEKLEKYIDQRNMFDKIIMAFYDENVQLILNELKK